MNVPSSESALDAIAQGVDAASFVHAMFGVGESAADPSSELAQNLERELEPAPQPWVEESIDWHEGDFAIEARSES